MNLSNMAKTQMRQDSRRMMSNLKQLTQKNQKPVEALISAFDYFLYIQFLLIKLKKKKYQPMRKKRDTLQIR